MTALPLVSIVIPLYNDAETVSAAIQSCRAQTLTEIEIVCIDDASTDDSAAIVERFIARDPRVRLIRHGDNLSAFQARRTGVEAARAPYVLFLDGDDELAPDAAERAVQHAQGTDSDIVAFGVTVVDRHGQTGGSYERRLQPAHATLEGPDVLRGLFPIGKPAQGQLWRHLYRTGVLRDAFDLLPDVLVLPRVNDLPLMFLVAAGARRYTSITEHLYRYHFGRGGSGHAVDSIERALFYVSAITSIDSIRDAVDALSATFPDPALLHDTYESARLSLIGYVCSQLVERGNPEVLGAALAHLFALVPPEDVVRAAARFSPATLSTLKLHLPPLGPGTDDVRSVVLATSSLRIGGVSAVMVSQARCLLEAGYAVTIVARGGESERSLVPAGAEFVELNGGSLVERLGHWAEICREHRVDVVIDHQVLYTRQWPEFALAARAEGAVTIGWLHTFVARPVYDGDDRLSHLERSAGTLAHLVALSPLDVAYFRLRGIDHVSFVPNPPSLLLTDAAVEGSVRRPPQGRWELIWWGRLEQRTKRVLDLIEVGVALRERGVDFRLRVIGPEWDGLTAKAFNRAAARRGVGDRVVAVGPLRGTALLSAIDEAHAFVSTSIIEGYQLTIAEAQSRGLPVFMYELPWLALVQDNDGVTAVPQERPHALAARVAEVMSDPGRYADMSRASLAAAQRALGYDFAALYRGVVTNSVPAEMSPVPTLDDAGMLLGLFVSFAERATRSTSAKSSPPPSAVSLRLWQTFAPAGRTILRRFPRLRRLAHRMKKRLRVH